MSKITINHNESIDFSNKLQKLEKQNDLILRKLEAQERVLKAQEREIYNLKLQRDQKDLKINTLEEKIKSLEIDSTSIYQLATRSFRFVKALAYSTGRFLSSSIFMEEPAEQVEYIKEFELKDPEQYPMGTYKARNGRLRNIVELVKEKGSITTQEIVRKFKICHHTARADMRDLLDAFPNALKLLIPKHRGRESYKLIETNKLSWGLPIETL